MLQAASTSINLSAEKGKKKTVPEAAKATIRVHLQIHPVHRITEWEITDERFEQG